MSNKVTPQEKLEAFIKENKIELKTTFVPFSFSRNAKKIDTANWDKKTNLYKEKDINLNWKVSLKGPKHAFTTDYSKGIGHLGYHWLNSFVQIKTVDDAKKANEYLYDGIEKGIAYNVNTVEQFKSGGLKKKKEFPTPTIKEVLESLSLDADVINYPTFESWAHEFGYDSDSRKDEKVYNLCKEIANDFVRVIGSKEKIQDLREILWEIDNEPYQKKESGNKP